MNKEKGKKLVERVVQDVGGAFVVGLAYIGDKLRLFKALAEHGPCDSDTLAEKTALNKRYVLEWLKGMVAAEYVEYESERNLFFMSEEQRAAFAEEGSPVFAAGGFQFTIPSLLQTPEIIESFIHGGGIHYDELSEEIATSIDRMHRPWFEYRLTTDWIPAVSGLVERLNEGISVLDVGCGLGRSSLAIANAYPNSHVTGVDPHSPSILKAKEFAATLNNINFKDITLEAMEANKQFDLIFIFDAIHDMQDPIGTLRTIKKYLAPEGLVFWSEPTGSHNPIENRNPIGKMRAAISPFHCLTVSLAADGAGLGTIIGEEGVRQLAKKAGYSTFEKLNISHPMQQFFGLRH